MKNPKPITIPRKLAVEQPATFPGAAMAAALTRFWGPLLAFIAFIALSGLIAMQFTRGDAVAAISISIIVVVAIVAALVARVKNVI
jgi:hypothetical protein